MAPTLQELGLDQLTPDERLAVAEALRDSVFEATGGGELSELQQDELARRLADSVARPDAVTPWEVVKARAVARARR